MDFIKMDIEGSEEKALLGAAKTIKKCTPKLAICIYHKRDDYYKLAKTILDINSRYEFYLKHNAYNVGETVLFCAPSRFPSELTDLAVTPRLRSYIDHYLRIRNERIKNFRASFYQLAENLVAVFKFFEPVTATRSDASYRVIPIKNCGRRAYRELVLKNT
ncbi:MAG: FkbM family methyltransferase, partial [Desulfovibrio sp.]|nr:FkbM family methyltransferase [Desulfovibrio sp.]